MTRPCFRAVGLVIVTLIAAGACRPSAPSAPPAPNDSTRPALADQAVERGTVRISEEMLRDLRVTTAPVEEHRGAESASMLGELGVNENRYAEIGVPLQARITRLVAVQGQNVRAGEALAILQSGELARARATFTTANARVALARQSLERRRSLNAERIVPMREVQEAENELRAAEAEVRSATSSLQALGVSDESTEQDASTVSVRSPIAGAVIERAGVLGAMADPEHPIFKIADLASLWLTVHAFERDAVRLRTGETARITFAAIPGRTFNGVVSFVGRAVEPESRTVPVRIEMPNADGLLRPGMSATAWLPVGDEAGLLLTVPSAALQRVRDRWCVFVPKDVRTFEIRPVGRGRDLAGEVEIVSGLKAGEIVVVDGAFLLKAETEKSSGEHEEH